MCTTITFLFFLNKTNKSTDLYNQGLKTKSDNPRPNRWIPVEVWQSKGITAHEMTLPQGIFIILIVTIISYNNFNF